MRGLVAIAFALAPLAGSVLAVPSAEPAAPPSAVAAEAPSPALEAWIKLLVEHLASKDERVRSGAALALRSAGPAARPALATAAASPDPELSAGAKRLLAQLEQPVRSARTARIGDALGLEGERLKAVESILGDLEQQRLQIVRKMQAGEVERAAAAEQITTLRRESDERLAGILDEEQMKRYLELTGPPSPAGD